MTARPLPQTCGPTPVPSATAPSPLAWIRPGQVGYLGPDLGVDLHATAIPVLTIGLDAPFILETAAHGATTTRSAFAPARTPHRVIAPEGRILLLFLDSADAPTNPLARAMQRNLGPIGLDHRLEHALITACDHGADPHTLHSLSTTPTPTPTPTPDRRITHLIESIRANPTHPFRAHESARQAGLSTSHFLRLFAEQTGTTFRRYQQWSRLLHVVRGISSGHDLTRCAADAGFASPSHLSDTFHRTLGTSPTTVLKSHVHFTLDF